MDTPVASMGQQSGLSQAVNNLHNSAKSVVVRFPEVYMGLLVIGIVCFLLLAYISYRVYNGTICKAKDGMSGGSSYHGPLPQWWHGYDSDNMLIPTARHPSRRGPYQQIPMHLHDETSGISNKIHHQNLFPGAKEHLTNPMGGNLVADVYSEKEKALQAFVDTYDPKPQELNYDPIGNYHFDPRF